MSFSKVTEEMVLLMEEILDDMPKVDRGNKTAAQRIRTKTVALTKVSKEWRRLSLDQEKKKQKKAAPKPTKKKTTVRKKT